MDLDGARAMDPTHPATRKRMAVYINQFKNLGFKMIKVDFLGHGSLEADRFYNPKVTTGMQAYASGMAYLDSLIGNNMLVYAAISPNLATAKYVHMRRIACDAFKSISETAYTLNSLTYGWWQSLLYDYLDADHVVFNGASAGENRARLLCSVVTGSLVVGDDYGKHGPWTTIATELLQNKAVLKIVSRGGTAFSPLEIQPGMGASAIFTKQVGAKNYIAVFNYGDSVKSIEVPIKKLGLGHKIKIHKIVAPVMANFNLQLRQGKLLLSMPAKDACLFYY